MELYPAVIRLAGSLVTVVGAGEVALRKAGDLLRCGARVRVVAASVHEGFSGLAEAYGGLLEIISRDYRRGDIAGSLLAVAATDDPDVNRAVFAEARESTILVNAVDDPSNCSFFVPASFRKGGLLLSVSTGGASPAMAARLCRELQEHIPGHIDSILEALAEARLILKNARRLARLDAAGRSEILQSIVNDDACLAELRAAHACGDLEAWLLRFMQSA